MSVPVKLPKEVLRLFPEWEHRCPSCGTYAESNISFCPRCKTAFDEKVWRVPPRFLRSPEAMSTYAHEVLAPKLTPEQREILFKHFTEFFSDGFESGNFNSWTSTAGSPTVQSDVAYSGDYAMLTPSDNDGQYAEKSVSAQSTVFVRFYVRWSSLSASSETRPIRLLGNSSLVTTVSVESDRIGIYGLSSFSYQNYTLNDGTWYCFEVKFVKDASNGEFVLYVDGSPVVSITGVNTSSKNAVDTIRLGLTDYGTYTTTVYIDSVVVADTYIGPETAEQTYTKTWITDVLFKKLGITKILGIDAALQKQDIPKTFGVDSAFQKNILVQKQLDALFKRFGVPLSFGLDARFGALLTQNIMRQIDVLFKKLDATRTFGLDAYFGVSEAQAYTESFGLDVVFAYRVRLPELWLDENGRLVLNISRPYVWVGT